MAEQRCKGHSWFQGETKRGVETERWGRYGRHRDGKGGQDQKSGPRPPPPSDPEAWATDTSFRRNQASQFPASSLPNLEVEGGVFIYFGSGVNQGQNTLTPLQGPEREDSAPSPREVRPSLRMMRETLKGNPHCARALSLSLTLQAILFSPSPCPLSPAVAVAVASTYLPLHLPMSLL